MGKKVNHKNKQSHGTRSEKVDRSKHWKFGKSSGDPERTAARKAKKHNEKN
jgi:hypothetical protein